MIFRRDERTDERYIITMRFCRQIDDSSVSEKMHTHDSSLVDEITIRQANVEDVVALTALLAERGFDHSTALPLVRERFADMIGAGDCILVAVLESEAIGMATLHRTHYLHRVPDGRIVSLVVSEHHRSRGVGVRLVESAETVFRAWGCGRAEVTSGAAREGAHRFYVRCGYEEQRKRFVKVL